MINDKVITPEKAMQRAQALCARQERCSYDIRLKLRQWQLSNADIDRIVNQLIADRFINDERYAKIFARDKSKLNKWGPLKITYTLKSKHFSDEIIRIALEELDPSTDESSLKTILGRKMKGTKSKSPYDLKAKLIRFGISKGFDYEIVCKITSSILNEG